MKKYWNMFFNWVFCTREDIKDKINDAVSKAVHEERTEIAERRRDFEIVEVSLWVGRPIIVISNEWEDPVIGICTGVDMISQSKCPVPVVKDYLTGEVFLVFGKIIPFNNTTFNAVMKLNPFERWALVSNNASKVDSWKNPPDVNLLDKEQIVAILEKNGFYDQLVKTNESS